MNRPALQITSLQNPRIKEVVKLQKRPYREVKRMLDNRRQPQVLFYAPAFFRGGNETALVERAAEAGAELFECTADVFQKIAYRDRPEGLLALTDQVRGTLADLKLPERPLLIVAESIEKPGNLGSLLRSADAAGVHGVTLTQAGCAGLCDREPMMTLVDAEGRRFRYGRLDARKVAEIVESHVVGGEPVRWLLLDA